MLLLNLCLPFCLVSASPLDIYDTQMGRYFFSFSTFILREPFGKAYVKPEGCIPHMWQLFKNKLSIKMSSLPFVLLIFENYH